MENNVNLGQVNGFNSIKEAISNISPQVQQTADGQQTNGSVFQEYANALASQQMDGIFQEGQLNPELSEALAQIFQQSNSEIDFQAEAQKIAEKSGLILQDVMPTDHKEPSHAVSPENYYKLEDGQTINDLIEELMQSNPDSVDILEILESRRSEFKQYAQELEIKLEEKLEQMLKATHKPQDDIADAPFKY